MEATALSAVASTWWAEVSAIAAAVAAVGTFLAPLFALQVSAYLERRREKHRQRFDLYQTLMQWRATPFFDQPVRSFNSIDTIFHDVQSVRDAWSDLFSAYDDSRLSSPEGARIRQDKLNALLQIMAHHLGYESHFTKADFERVYNPVALGKRTSIFLEQVRRTHDELFSHQQTTTPKDNL